MGTLALPSLLATPEEVGCHKVGAEWILHRLLARADASTARTKAQVRGPYCQNRDYVNVAALCGAMTRLSATTFAKVAATIVGNQSH